MEPGEQKSSTPEECCENGHLLYPLAKAEAKAQVVPGLYLTLPVIQAVAIVPGISRADSPISDSPRPPGTPLYELTATYRL